MNVSRDVLEAFRKSEEAESAFLRSVAARMFRREDEWFTNHPAMKWRAVLSMKGAKE